MSEVYPPDPGTSYRQGARPGIYGEGALSVHLQKMETPLPAHLYTQADLSMCPAALWCHDACSLLAPASAEKWSTRHFRRE